MNLLKSLKFIEGMEIYDQKQRKYTKIQLWPDQVTLVEKYITKFRYVIVLKRRQVGVSEITGADVLANTLAFPRFVTLVFSIGERESALYLDRIRQKWERLDNEIRQGIPIDKNSQTELSFKNGSKILSLPSSTVSGSSFTANRVVVDEAGKIQNLPDLLASVEPTIQQAGGQLILLGTAQGMNHFHQVWKDAEARRNGFMPFFMGAYSDPAFTEEKRKRLVIQFGEDHVNQEYPRTPDEAFLSTGNPRFNRKTLQSRYQPNPIMAKSRGYIEDKDQVIFSRKGPLKFYHKLKPYGQYMIVADVAEGLAHGDYNCAKVFDWETWGQVAEWHGHIEPAEFGTILADMGRHWNNAYMVIECNNHGISTIARLKDMERYPERLIFAGIHQKEKTDDRFINPERRWGWHTTIKSKKAIIDNLAQAINEEVIPQLSRQDISELFTYVRDDRGRTNADDNCYDDRVMCLAIGYYLLSVLSPRRLNEADKQNCETCINYRVKTTDCKVTGRFIANRDKIWCDSYREDRTWLETPIEFQKDRSGYYRGGSKYERIGKNY